jgi:hypothetical protein
LFKTNEAGVDYDAGEPIMPCRKMKRTWVQAFCFCLATIAAGQRQHEMDRTRLISIPRGALAVVDGNVSAKEWDDSGHFEITIGPDWKIPVRFKHDDQNLYFLFERVTNHGERLFPELFFDVHDQKDLQWKKGYWWFHVSANLCESQGAPNVYRKDGVFQCAHRKSGWDANNPPTQHTDAVEIRISFDKIGINSSRPMRMGFAAAVTNATGDEKQVWHFWPLNSSVESPRTWGAALLE